MLPARLQLIGGAALLYLIGISSIVMLLVDNSQAAEPAPRTMAPAAIHKPATPRFVVLSGTPVRVVIPDSGIDIIVGSGDYNTETREWSLSDTQASFATMTTPPNNASGNTLIYGHGTDAVFGPIGTTNPQPNAQALLYTDNGHIFLYRFQSVRDLTPDDTAILYDTVGPPRMTIQTCTGMFSEWRTMFEFSFEKVLE